MFWSYKPIGLLLLTVAAMAGLSSVSHAVLVAHYKFEEPTGSATTVNEVAANGGNGTIGANVTLGVAGIDGNAFLLNDQFTDADIVDMGNASVIFDAINASGQITISYWMKSTDVSGGRNVAVFLGNDTVASDYLDSGIIGGAGATSGSAQGRNRAFGNANIGELVGPSVIDNAFHHVALTVDTTTGDAGTLYVDGLLVASGAGTAYSKFPVFNNFEIGRLGRAVKTDAYAGVIDDLQLYSNTVSARDVSRLFNNPGETLIDLGPSVEGDTNDDGVVNVTDFNNIRNSLGYSGLAPGLGVDIAGNDGVIDFRDLRYFQQNFPSIVAAASAQSVPEPATVVLTLFAVGLVARVARRNRHRNATL